MIFFSHASIKMPMFDLFSHTLFIPSRSKSPAAASSSAQRANFATTSIWVATRLQAKKLAGAKKQQSTVQQIQRLSRLGNAM